ncbi:MAG TPA: hypothetical protein VIN58_24545, partial [Roseateles sp.]
VSSTTNTTLNASATPIAPPTTTVRPASGIVTVAPVASPIMADVVARKVLADGLVVEVAGSPVDGSTGAFSFDLPSTAPQRAAYVAGTTAISFAADSVAPTGKYTLVASSGASVKSMSIDISTTAATSLAIALP